MTTAASVANTAAALVAPPAFAQSSKAAWNYDDVVPLGTAAAQVPGDPLDGDTGWVPILTSYIKTPNAKEIAIGVSLQCALVTDTTVRSRNGVDDTSSGQGRMKVQVRITQPDGTIVYGQPRNGTDLSDVLLNADTGLTYCDRFQKLAAAFSGLNCYIDTAAVDGDLRRPRSPWAGRSSAQRRRKRLQAPESSRLRPFAS